MTVGSGHATRTGTSPGLPNDADPLTTARRCATALAEATEQVQVAYGDTLGVRRLRSDVDRLIECLNQLGPPLPGHHPPRPQALETISDEPYDESLWVDAEYEGLGAPDRRAP